MTNNDALDIHAALFVIVTATDTIEGSNIFHPMLSKLKISSVEMTALEDFTEDIQSLQVEKKNR